MVTVNFRPQIVKFGVWLTGHSEEDISQMLDDFSNGSDKSFPVDKPVVLNFAEEEKTLILECLLDRVLTLKKMVLYKLFASVADEEYCKTKLEKIEKLKSKISA